MCFNCGCQRPEDDMGNPDNLTIDDFELAANAGNRGNVEEALRNTRELIDRVLSQDVPV